ncbi:hypothetical protein DFH06DRAFT_114386 [Mycena polygramma]|nr:hypothetical protein DFH06DRAFT_114386 [Mycena polygramma]
MMSWQCVVRIWCLRVVAAHRPSSRRMVRESKTRRALALSKRCCSWKVEESRHTEPSTAKARLLRAGPGEVFVTWPSLRLSRCGATAAKTS